MYILCNCSDDFNEFHAERYSRIPISELIEEYDAICEVLCLDSCGLLPVLDELLSCKALIEDRCIEIVREMLKQEKPDSQ